MRRDCFACCGDRYTLNAYWKRIACSVSMWPHSSIKCNYTWIVLCHSFVLLELQPFLNDLCVDFYLPHNDSDNGRHIKPFHYLSGVDHICLFLSLSRSFVFRLFICAFFSEVSLFFCYSSNFYLCGSFTYTHVIYTFATDTGLNIIYYVCNTHTHSVYVLESRMLQMEMEYCHTNYHLNVCRLFSFNAKKLSTQNFNCILNTFAVFLRFLRRLLSIQINL